MLALVDGVPRTLPIDAFIRYWFEHQIDVIQRRTDYRLRKAEEEIHILRGYLKALDALDEVIALIRRSPTVEEARDGLIELLEIDEIQARAILDLQLRRLAALERQKIIDDHDKLQAQIDGLHATSSPSPSGSATSSPTSSPPSSRSSATSAARRSCRPTATCRWRTSSPRRTSSSPSPAAATPSAPGSTPTARSGAAARACAGAALRGEDMVEHFFTTTSHHWLLFFTNLGRVYRAKAYELPDAGRDAKGQHVANVMAFQPGEEIAQVLAIRSYDDAPYLVLATRAGLVKKTRLGEYDSPRTGGLIAINLRDGDELVGVGLVTARRRPAAGLAQGPVGALPRRRRHAAADGPRHLRRHRDEVPHRRRAALDVGRRARATDPDVFVVFESGLAKRSKVSEWNVKGRAILGVAVAKLSDKGGDLVGALTVDENDEVLVVFEKGNIVRSRVDEVRLTGRNTMGVQFAKPGKNDAIVAVARNPEKEVEEAVEDAEAELEEAGDESSRLLRPASADVAAPAESEGVDRRTSTEPMPYRRTSEPDRGGRE